MLLELSLSPLKGQQRDLSLAPFELILKLSEISLIYLRGLLMVFLLVPFGNVCKSPPIRLSLD